jgi:hypothetical protein
MIYFFAFKKSHIVSESVQSVSILQRTLTAADDVDSETKRENNQMGMGVLLAIESTWTLKPDCSQKAFVPMPVAERRGRAHWESKLIPLGHVLERRESIAATSRLFHTSIPDTQPLAALVMGRE